MRTTLSQKLYRKLKNQIMAGTVVCLPFSLLSAPCCAQDVPDGDSWREDYATWAADDEPDEATLSDWEDQISQLAEHPFSINTDTIGLAKRLPFLSTRQINAMNEYLSRYGRITSAAELLLIPELDLPTVKRLVECIDFDSGTNGYTKSLSECINEAEHQAIVTASVPFYTTYGDRSAYLGPRYKHSLRYTLNCSDQLKVGFVAAQDAGEPFFAGRNKWGYDHFSPFVMYRGRGLLRTIALGNYRLSMGLGLVMNTNMSFGKASMLPTFNAGDNELRVHSSRSASNYLQGVATELSLSHNLQLTLFASSRLIDTTPTSDGNAIQTILSSGYHRTESEMSRKHNARQSSTGLNLRFTSGQWYAGLTAVATALSKRLSPDRTALYRQYYPSGKQFWNASIYYGYAADRFSFTGETATGRTGGIATLQSLVYSPHETVELQLVARHYSARYSSLYANAFGNNSRVSNESGALLALNWYLGQSYTLKAYTDYAYSPKPRYGISASSHEWDNSLMLERSTFGSTFSLRYRLHLRQRDDEQLGRLHNYTEQRWRLRWASRSYAKTVWRLQADVVVSTQKQNSTGWMLSAMGGLNHRYGKIRLSAAYFHTDDYYSRLYLTENTLRYAMSLPMVYGQGCHGQLYFTTHSWHNLTLASRLSVTKYFDRDTIGSSYQLIDSSVKANLELQLIWHFVPKNKIKSKKILSK